MSNDDLGPLGPLGAAPQHAEESEEPPELPRKEQQPARAAKTSASVPNLPKQQQSQHPDDEEIQLPSRPRYAGSAEISGYEQPERHMQPSMSIEQAAKPSFHITVGDAHKVGDITSSHTVYQVHTKVRLFIHQVSYSLLILCHSRLHLKPIESPNLKSHAAIAIFSGYTTNYIQTIQVL